MRAASRPDFGGNPSASMCADTSSGRVRPMTAQAAGAPAVTPRRNLRPWPERLSSWDAWCATGKGWDVQVIPGRIGPSGRPVANRTIEYDLKFLVAVLNWAAKSRDEGGRLLLDRNPLRELKTPSEKNPVRVVLAEEEYRALLEVSRRVDWRFQVALVLAHETGHRIGAIRQLRWSDIDFEGGTIVWRAEHDKSGYEHITPATAEALAALEEARMRSSGVGNVPLLPAPRSPSACMGAALAQRLWDRAERLAGLEPKRGRGWHSLRRKFASDLMDQPLKVLCQLGGWKTAARAPKETPAPFQVRSPEIESGLDRTHVDALQIRRSRSERARRDRARATAAQSSRCSKSFARIGVASGVVSAYSKDPLGSTVHRVTLTSWTCAQGSEPDSIQSAGIKAREFEAPNRIS